MFTFFCPRCGHKLRVPDAWAGDEASCAGCRATIQVPVLGEAAVARTAPLAEEGNPLEAVSDSASSDMPNEALLELAEKVGEVAALPHPAGSKCPQCGAMNPRGAGRCHSCENVLYEG